MRTTFVLKSREFRAGAERARFPLKVVILERTSRGFCAWTLVFLVGAAGVYFGATFVLGGVGLHELAVGSRPMRRSSLCVTCLRIRLQQAQCGISWFVSLRRQAQPEHALKTGAATRALRHARPPLQECHVQPRPGTKSRVNLWKSDNSGG